MAENGGKMASMNEAGKATAGGKPKDTTSKHGYFDSYAHFSTHEQVLKDTVRIGTYREAVRRNPHLFKDKVVMDVGSGTGILSMFAAKAGAKKVFAVEFSNMAITSKQVIKVNGLSNVIEVIHARVEDIQELPGGIGKVDVIISAWMGYCLFYQSTLDAVLYARDKWLRADGQGVLFPDRAKLFIGAIEDRTDRRDHVDWWNDVYGFNMNRIRKLVLDEPLVAVVDNKKVVSNYCVLKDLDLYTVTASDLSFHSPFLLHIARNVYVHAFVTYFTVEFTKCHQPTGFSTSPACRPTRWQQTVFCLKDELPAKEGEMIEGHFSLKPNEQNPRELDINIKMQFKGKVCEHEEDNHYKMH